MRALPFISPSPQQKAKVQIAVLTDERYSRFTAVTVKSVLAHLRPSDILVVHVFSDHFNQEMRQSFSTAWMGHEHEVIGHVVNTTQLVGKVQLGGHIEGLTTYFRLFLGDLIDESVDRVIYLDSDLIILSDLGTLWRLPLQNKIMAAVIDAFDGNFCAFMSSVPLEEFQASEGTEYFNAGLMLIDLERWRKNDIGNKALTFAKKYKRYFKWYDQDALNCALYKHWLPLPPVWNQMTQLFDKASWKQSRYARHDFEQALRAPKVMHFTGNSKPWKISCDDYRAPLYRKWWQNTFQVRMDRSAKHRFKDWVARSRRRVKRFRALDLAWRQDDADKRSLLTNTIASALRQPLPFGFFIAQKLYRQACETCRKIISIFITR